MNKYSIIVTVFNKEKYISRCIDSILSQKYKDFDLIIVDDGSTDNSENIINNYKDTRIKYYKKSNSGVSDTRNYSINKVITKYFTFVDADDYVSDKLLCTIDKIITDDIDVLSFNIKINNSDELKPSFDTNGEEAIIKLINSNKLFDTPVAYLYNTDYFKNNKFKYAVGKVHEDFGLTPLTILKANRVISISDCLYFYDKNNEGITGSKNNKKKAWDMLYHFDYSYKEVNNLNINRNTKKIFNSFLANSLINKLSTLKEDYNEYLLELKKRKINTLLLSNNLMRLLKKILITININMYIKLFLKENKND
jgi:glycosyltransferase involved in cell wall biosynthesis